MGKKNQQANPRVLQDQHLRQNTKHLAEMNLAKVLKVNHHNPRKNLVVEFLQANRLIQEVQQSNHLLPKNHQVQASLIHSHPLHPLAVKQALNLSRKQVHQKNHLESSRLGHLQSPHRAKKNQQANPRVLQDQHLRQNTKNLAEKNLAKVLKVNHHNPKESSSGVPSSKASHSGSSAIESSASKKSSGTIKSDSFSPSTPISSETSSESKSQASSSEKSSGKQSSGSSPITSSSQEKSTSESKSSAGPTSSSEHKKSSGEESSQGSESE